MSETTTNEATADATAPRTYQSAWQWNTDGTSKLMTAEEWLEEEADVGDAISAPDDDGPSREGILRAIAEEITTLRRERAQWAEAATKGATLRVAVLTTASMLADWLRSGVRDRAPVHRALRTLDRASHGLSPADPFASAEGDCPHCGLSLAIHPMRWETKQFGTLTCSGGE